MKKNRHHVGSEMSRANCTYQTEDVSVYVVSQLLALYALQHNNIPVTASRGPRLTRPSIDIGVDEETWIAFLMRLETFKLGSGINDDAAPTQLFQCASKALGDMLLEADPKLTTKSTADVIKAMKQLVVIPFTRGVTRTELLQMKQSCEEPVRIRGKA